MSLVIFCLASELGKTANSREARCMVKLNRKGLTEPKKVPLKESKLHIRYSRGGYLVLNQEDVKQERECSLVRVISMASTNGTYLRFYEKWERSKSIFKYNTSGAVVVAAIVASERGWYKDQERGD